MHRALQKSGLDDNADLKLIWPLIKHSNSILEVGAGYGRALEFLMNKNYQGKISALERSKKLFQTLLARYPENVHLFNESIQKFNTGKYDAVLWLWAGVSDFSEDEQITTIGLLADLLEPGGQLIIDTMTQLNNEKFHNHSFCIGPDRIHRCIPSSSAMIHNAHSARLNVTQKIEYGSTEMKRCLYFLARDSETIKP